MFMIKGKRKAEISLGFDDFFFENIFKYNKWHENSSEMNQKKECTEVDQNLFNCISFHELLLT